MGQTHDSVEDARTALEAAVHFIQNSHPNGFIEVDKIQKDGEVVAGTDLFVHRITDTLTEENIMQLFIAQTFVCPTKVPQIQRDPARGPETGKAVVSFASAAHADLALETISGPQRPDKSGRSQKRVYLKGGGYIYVRKV